MVAVGRSWMGKKVEGGGDCRNNKKEIMEVRRAVDKWGGGGRGRK